MNQWGWRSLPRGNWSHDWYPAKDCVSGPHPGRRWIDPHDLRQYKKLVMNILLTVTDSLSTNWNLPSPHVSLTLWGVLRVIQRSVDMVPDLHNVQLGFVRPFTANRVFSNSWGLPDYALEVWEDRTPEWQSYRGESLYVTLLNKPNRSGTSLLEPPQPSTIEWAAETTEIFTVLGAGSLRSRYW